MPTVTEQSAPLTFEAPGGGAWMLDTTHHGRRPVSRFMQPIVSEVFPSALTAVCERFGLPMAEFRAAIVHGCFYMRPVGIGEPDDPKGEPPLVVLKLVSRLHPEMRRRARTARKAWNDKLWREDVDNWFDRGGRDATIAENRRFQAVDVQALSDDELAEHLHSLEQHVREQAYQSGATHGGDIIPIGDYMAHCNAWGIPQGQAAALLAGSSPASLETSRILQPVGQAVASTDGSPSSVAEIRELTPAAAAAIDEWLSTHGHRVVTSDDVDGETLIERPDLQFKALLAAAADPTEPQRPSADAVRAQVPSDQRALFDELLTEARYGLRLRDDNVGVRWNWPVGLARRAVLEAGRRLATKGALEDPAHMIEAHGAEIQALLRTEAGPTKQEMSERWAFRHRVIASTPPDTLGGEGGEPPIAAFPKPLARATSAMLAMISAMEGDPIAEPLTGVGIGPTSHTGRAIVVNDAIEALERVEPGDVVIAPFTGPSWNSLLPTVGALVVEEGGPMSHAAIVAREFEIPAVVGARRATELVPDGAQVTVDPATGTITLH